MTVAVPEGLERQVARLLVHGMAVVNRANGGNALASDAMNDFIERLWGADHLPALSASGHSEVPAGTLETWTSIADAAEEVGMNERTLRRLCQSGAVKAQRVGQRTWSVNLEDVHRHLQGSRP